jgi:hypothetical protein
MAITINGNGTVTGVSVGGLPDGIVDTDMIAANAVTAAKAAGSVKGITEMDQWRLTTNVALGAGGADLTSNWERSDTAFSKIGTGMTESSGIFTFPATGIWQIFFNGTSQDTDKNRYAGVEIFYSTDSGSNYSALSENWDSIHDSSSDTVYSSFSTQGIIDVTNISTFRIKFKVAGESAMNISGSTSANRTNVTFTRLGDT